MLDDVGQPFGLLLSVSNTECVGVILSQAAFNWIPVLVPHHNKPSWAVSASSSTVETVLLTEAGIDPLPTVSTNLSLFLVPMIFPFTFKLPSLDNLRLEDMSELATAHGNNVSEWAQIMLNYRLGVARPFLMLKAFFLHWRFDQIDSTNQFSVKIYIRLI